MNVFEQADIKGKKNEPQWHPSAEKGFLFVPTAGMRVAPEILVLECFREVFFERFYEEDTETQLQPDNSLGDLPFSDLEKTVLFATRGRIKRNYQSSTTHFYAPIYPSLARNAWLRKRSDRVIRDFLFSALTQYLNGRGRENLAGINAAADKIFEGLLGHNTVELNSERRDIFSVALKDTKFPFNREECIERLKNFLSNSGRVFRTPDCDDQLAMVIHDDFIKICELEKNLPRLQWLEVLKCFLRISTSIWFLAHSRITVLLRDRLLETIETGKLPESSSWVQDLIADRSLDLLHPSTTPSKQVLEHVETYMRARVELNAMLWVIEKFSGESLLDRVITTHQSSSSDVSLDQLLLMAKKTREHINTDNPEPAFRDQLTRYCEDYPSWVRPLKAGQGKNYDEFLRVLRRMQIGDEDGSYLLTSAYSRGNVVMPGHMMLKVFVYLGGCQIENRKLILRDVEEHFRSYGINFGVAAGARPRLIEALHDLGLLRGSPDAGDSVEVSKPFDKR